METVSDHGLMLLTAKQVGAGVCDGCAWLQHAEPKDDIAATLPKSEMRATKVAPDIAC